MADIKTLYGSKEKSFYNRKKKLINTFEQLFSTLPDDFFSSPGRIEIIGNHTDHNNGLVMVSSIDLDTLCATKKNASSIINLQSEGYRMISIDLNDSPKEDEYQTSTGIVRGVCERFKELGYKVGGFDACCSSKIFKGAGLSSSAAFELLVCEILNYYFNESKISRVEMAKISQYSENVFFKKPCGLLDQMGISLGGFNYIDFKDTKNPKIESFNFSCDEYRIVLTNTGGSHANLTKAYAAIKDDMHEISQFFKKDVLREVNEDDFYSCLRQIKAKVGGRAILRAIHFYSENARVKDAYQALLSNDMNKFLSLINESGESSYNYLQNCFIEKDKEQGIALALAISKSLIKNGACRVHGGGFKGTIIAYVHKNEQLKYIETMKEIFGERNVLKVQLRSVGTCHIEE